MKHIKHINEGIGESQYVKINGYNRSFYGEAARLGGLPIEREYILPRTLIMIYEMFKTRRINIDEGDHIYIGVRDGDINIYSFHDEWFLVSKGNASNSHFDWWKCDQDDQLKSLLKNIS
jgi:hypothetical protein